MKLQDPTTGAVFCETDGRLAPCPGNDPALCGPTDDADDCLSDVFTGAGFTCGTGGGDGGYWVILAVHASVGNALAWSNPATMGTIAAF